MGWKCPECGNQHEDISADCSCGYSLYKILGIKPGASAAEARQAHKYLLTVWQDRSAVDAASRKKAEERLSKINLAYEILKENLPGGPSEVKKSSSLKISLSVGAGAIMLFGILAIYTGVFKSEKNVLPGPQQRNETSNLPAHPAEKGHAGQGTGAPANESTDQPVQSDSQSAFGTGADMTEEMAIETVKKSHVLFSNTSTEAIIKKWTEDNSAKLQLIGWKARKMDEERYLVSYIAMDGAVPKGFYFDLDTRTGEVVNLANRPDLQKKYNIRYSQ